MSEDLHFQEVYLPSAIIGNAFRIWWFQKHTVNIRGKDIYQHHDTVSLTRIPFLRRNIQYKRRTRKHCSKQKLKNPSFGMCVSVVDMFQQMSSSKPFVIQEASSLSSVIGRHRGFPPYNPKGEGRWNPPPKPLNAFQLYANECKQVNPDIDNESIIQQWTCLETKDFEQWDQKQEHDRTKYKYYLRIYKQARCRAKLGYVLYHYLYLDNRGKLCVQIEKRSDRKCPFCSYDAFHDIGLILHCKTVHTDDLFHKKKGKLLTFEAGIDEDRNLHVLVKSGKLGIDMSNKEGSSQPVKNKAKPSTKIIYWKGQTSHSYNVSEISIPFIRKPPRMTTLLETQTRKRKIKQLEQRIRHDDRCHPLALSQFQVSNDVPVRQYYHTKTMQPMGEGEWNIDSGDEGDDEWFHTLADHMIHEYKDNEVLKEEKIFCIMWNRFAYSNTALADSEIPKLCTNFVLKYRNEISRQNLRDQLLLHLMNLWDNQLLSWKMIIDLMYVFDYGVLRSQEHAHRLVDTGEQNGHIEHLNGDRKRLLLFEEMNNDDSENIERNNHDNTSVTVGKISIPIENDIKRLRTNSWTS